jgi:hypothetical protein
MKPVHSYPAGKDSRAGAASRSQSAKQRELVRRGSDSGNAAKHANHMVARQSTGDPNADTSDGGM